MANEVINLIERKELKESQRLFGINTKLLGCTNLSWPLIQEESFCKKKITDEPFYIPKNYNRTDDEIEVQNKYGALMYIDIDALAPFPQLNDSVKVIFQDDSTIRYRIVPPNWNIIGTENCKQKVGMLILNNENKKILIVFDDGITWETNLKYK